MGNFNLRKLVDFIEQTCEEHGIEIKLSKGKYVLCNKIKCNGYFDYEAEKLAVATNIKSWELILVHEFSHFMQWLEDCKEWRAYIRDQKAGEVVEPALAGKSVDTKKLRGQLRTTMMMERDCERRSVELLQQFHYPEDKVRQYIQKANAYTIFYLHIEKTRKWYKVGSEPYNKAVVWKNFPETFDIDVAEVYKHLGDLYEHCY